MMLVGCFDGHLVSPLQVSVLLNLAELSDVHLSDEAKAHLSDVVFAPRLSTQSVSPRYLEWWVRKANRDKLSEEFIRRKVLFFHPFEDGESFPFTVDEESVSTPLLDRSSPVSWHEGVLASGVSHQEDVSEAVGLFNDARDFYLSSMGIDLAILLSRSQSGSESALSFLSRFMVSADAPTWLPSCLSYLFGFQEFHDYLESFQGLQTALPLSSPFF